MEEWKTINLLGLDYEVSNTGKIKGLGRNKELKQRYTQDGYLEVTVGKEHEGRTSRRVHTLVALAFIPKPNDYEIFEINHKDLNRENNNVDNLEWVTHQENIDYSVKNNYESICKSKRGMNNGRATFTEEEVLLIRKMFDEGKCIADIVRFFHPELKTPKQYKNIHSTFSNIVHRRTWKNLERE